jgi:hypothetical protein
MILLNNNDQETKKKDLNMHRTCEYCNATFVPREQVKRPRACKNSKCQKRRQSDNEKAWRAKNKGLYDKKYHQIKSSERVKNLNSTCQIITKSLFTGLRFSGIDFNQDFELILKLFTSIGIRKLNKLCLSLSP